MQLKFLTEDDVQVGSSTGPVVPRVGEYIWLQWSDGGRSAWRVTEVAYWCPDRSRGALLDMNSAAVYVESIDGGVANGEGTEQAMVSNQP